MKKYLMLAKNTFMASLAYRAHIMGMVLTNIFYIILVYFLWKAVYQGATILNNLSFNQAFVYLSLSGSLFILFQTWNDWEISRRILSGDIIMDIIKPFVFFRMRLFTSIGRAGSNLISITIPSFVIIIIFFRAQIPVGPNIVIFIVSVLLAFFISNTIDYMIGLTSFYTESIWGIYAVKETIVLCLSGAVIPLGFFPESIKSILTFLPFQAIYHIPLTILTTDKFSIGDSLFLILTQFLWCIAMYFLSKIFFNKAIKVLIVNGG